jgi:hypothetical protein
MLWLCAHFLLHFGLYHFVFAHFWLSAFWLGMIQSFGKKGLSQVQWEKILKHNQIDSTGKKKLINTVFLKESPHAGIQGRRNQNFEQAFRQGAHTIGCAA